MTKPRDMVGETFGRLRVVAFRGKTHHRMWECECSCGKHIVVSAIHLTSGHTTSCGCVRNTNHIVMLGNLGVCFMKKGFFLFSPESLPIVKKHAWYVQAGYVRTTINRNCVGIHRLILNPSLGEEVDHINGNTLDNRIENLRRCSHFLNGQNQRALGYSYDKKAKAYRAYIGASGKQIVIGWYPTKEEARQAYIEVCREWRGEFSRV